MQPQSFLALAAVFAIVGATAACGAAPDPVDSEPEAPPAEATPPVPTGPSGQPAWRPPETEDAVRFEAVAPSVDLLIRLTGIGANYRGYLTERDRLATLASDVAPCLTGPAELVLTYDPSSSDGRIVLVVPKGRLSCPAAVGTDEGVDITPLTPLTKAVATYRQGLGQTRDLRILSWRAGVLLDDVGGKGVTLWIGGTPPGDGSEVRPCVDLDGTVHCPEGARDVSGEGTTVVTAATPKARQALARRLHAIP